MNIGTLTEYATLIRRVETQSSSGAIVKSSDTTLGYIFCRVNARPNADKSIAGGVSDSTSIEVLARYFDVYQLGLKAEDFIEIDSRYYKVKGFAEDQRYGFKNAVLIHAEMMNQGTISIS